MLEWKQQNDGRSALSEKFSSRVDKRLLVYAKDLRKDGQTILLPVYISAAPITNNPFSAALSVG